MAWLDDNQPARPQFRLPRRGEPSGVVVVHTAENTPDFVAFDGGAEAVARFIRGRDDAGSYHDLADSDSAINLVRYDAEAFHDGTGGNRHSYGVSVATRADVWPLAPKEWRDGAVRQAAAAAARYALWLQARTGIVIPARRITRAESERRVPGFISHAERDPARRRDPGRDFPWQQFFAEYLRALGYGDVIPEPETPEENDMRIMDCEGKPAVLLGGTESPKFLRTPADRAAYSEGLKVPAHKVKLEEYLRAIAVQWDEPIPEPGDPTVDERLEAIEATVRHIVER